MSHSHDHAQKEKEADCCSGGGCAAAGCCGEEPGHDNHEHSHAGGSLVSIAYCGG